MKKIFALLLTLTLIPQTFVFAAGADEDEKQIEKGIEYQAYELISGYIAEKYIDDQYTTEDIMMMGISKYLEENGDEALVAILKAALSELDDYSDFYTPEEYIEYNNAINKTFYGLGVTLQQAGEYVEITEFVEEGGLAQQSGFKIGDRFLEVDGVNVVGWSVTEVRNVVVGELGTTVNIAVMRDGERVDLVGTRTAVNTTTVSGGIFKGNIGYIKILSFSKNTATEFKEIAEKFKAEGVKKIILDLRDNGGGLVSAAIDIAEEIVPKGKIIDVKYRDASMNYTYESKLDKAPFEIVTLVNKNTASSSEILASAIQDSGAGILMGEDTYGKAVIQSPYYLKNGMVLKLTVGQYITRNGNEIDHIGLMPDKEVANSKKKIDTTGYTKFDFLTPASLGASGENVKAAKERLAFMNYYKGNLGNDVYNVDLKEAVAKFQRDNNLTDSGVLDVSTQIKLKETFENLETVIDTQLETAYEYLGGNADDLYAE